MAVGSSLAIDRAAQVQVTDDGAGAQVEVFLDELADLLIGDLAGVEGLDVNRQRVGHADGIGHLDLAAVRQPGGDHILGSPAGGIGGRTIDLGGVLAREGTAAMPAHAAIGVDDDLATGHAGVTHWAANDETPGGVDVHLEGFVGQFSRNGRHDDMLHDAFFDLGVRNFRRMLGANEHGVNAFGLAEGIFDGDLGLAIRAQPGQRAALAHLGQLAGELVGQVDGHGHELPGLIAGIAEHHALVAGADQVDLVLIAFLGFEGLADAHIDIRTLAGNGRKHSAGIAIEALLAAVVPNLLDHPADEFVKVDEGVGSDLAEQHHEAGLGGNFAGHPAHGVLFEAGVQHGIGDLVTQFVRMAFGYRFRGEQQFWRRHKSGCHWLPFP